MISRIKLFTSWNRRYTEAKRMYATSSKGLIRAMTILMKSQTGKDFTFTDKLVSIVSVIRIRVSDYTAKHRPLPERLQEK